jgi:hypothetical protein
MGRIVVSVIGAHKASSKKLKMLLSLKEECTAMIPVRQGVTFLGFRVFPRLIRLDVRKWAHFRRKVKRCERDPRSRFCADGSSRPTCAQHKSDRVMRAIMCRQTPVYGCANPLLLRLRAIFSIAESLGSLATGQWIASRRRRWRRKNSKLNES